MPKISSSIARFSKQKMIPAIVIDVLGPTCSVKLSGTGKEMKGLYYSGPTPTVGQQVQVNYQTGMPYVQTGTSLSQAPQESLAVPLASVDISVNSTPPAYPSAAPTESALIGSVYLDKYGLQIWNEDVNTGWIQTDGDMVLGSDIGDVDKTVFALFTNGQVYNTETMGAGDLLLGSNTNGFANLLWDVSAKQLKFRGGQVTHLYIDVDGTLVAGDGAVVLSNTGIVAEAGTIGGFTLTEDSLIAGADENTAGMYTDGVHPVFFAGAEDPDTAPFRVYANGDIVAEGLEVAATVESDNYVTDISGWRIDPSGWAEFANIKLRGKISSAVFEKETVSGIAGRTVVTEASILITDVTAIATTIQIENQALVTGDMIHLKSADREEYMYILDDGTAIVDDYVIIGYEYEVTRDIEVDGAELWYIGEAVFREGTATMTERASMFGEFGSSFGDMSFGGNAFTFSGGWLTLEGSRETGPYFGVSRRIGIAYNQIFNTVRFGNLKDFLDIDEERYGIGMGDLRRFMRYTYEDGLLIRTAAGGTLIDDNGVTTNSLIITSSDVPEFADDQACLYVNNDEIRVHYKNGVYETDTLLNRLDGYPPILSGDETIDRVIQVYFNGETDLVAADRAMHRVMACMNGWELIEVAAHCGKDNASGASTSGTIEISIQNGTTNMLSTNLTIDAGEYDSMTAIAPAAIDDDYKTILTGDTINFEIVGQGTGVKHLIVLAVFRKPSAT